MTGRPKRALLALLLILLVASIGQPGAKAQGENRVGLVVQFSNGSYLSRCILFSESRISGYDVLLRSGLELGVSVEGGMGVFICSIGGIGCPVTNCMCDYPPNYWSYWHLVNGEWVYSQMGASGHMINHGDVEGWSWGAGSPPVVIPFEQICAPPATDTPLPTETRIPSPTLSATLTPTPTQTPTASATPAPTHTSPAPPTATAVASATPLPTATTPLTATGVPPAAATKASTSTPTPTPTALPTGAPTAAPRTAAETDESTIAAKLMVSATPLQSTSFPVPTAPATATSLASATATVTRVPSATRAGVPEQSAPSQQNQKAATQLTKRLLTWLSVGAGVSYLFFLAFIVLLGALFVFVKIRQR